MSNSKTSPTDTKTPVGNSAVAVEIPSAAGIGIPLSIPSSVVSLPAAIADLIASVGSDETEYAPMLVPGASVNDMNDLGGIADADGIVFDDEVDDANTAEEDIVLEDNGGEVCSENAASDMTVEELSAALFDPMGLGGSFTEDDIGAGDPDLLGIWETPSLEDLAEMRQAYPSMNSSRNMAGASPVLIGSQMPASAVASQMKTRGPKTPDVSVEGWAKTLATMTKALAAQLALATPQGTWIVPQISTKGDLFTLASRADAKAALLLELAKLLAPIPDIKATVVDDDETLLVVKGPHWFLDPLAALEGSFLVSKFARIDPDKTTIVSDLNEFRSRGADALEKSGRKKVSGNK